MVAMAMKERTVTERMFFGVVVVTVFLSLLGWRGVGWGQATEKGKNGPPRIQIIPTEYDFGVVSPEKVRHTFLVKNIGGGTLEIFHVSTSCGCTTVSINKQTIEPGETAELVVSYDPNFHASTAKKRMFHVKRSVYVRSNDPRTPEKAVYITATIKRGT